MLTMRSLCVPNFLKYEKQNTNFVMTCKLSVTLRFLHLQKKTIVVNKTKYIFNTKLFKTKNLLCKIIVKNK